MKRTPLRAIKGLRRSKNKYNNKTGICMLKHRHDSYGEAGYCDTLELARRGKLIKSFEIQKEYRLIVNSKTVCKHIVDFQVYTNDNKIEVHEFKGFATREWAIKRKLFIALYPDIPYIVIH